MRPRREAGPTYTLNSDASVSMSANETLPNTLAMADTPNSPHAMKLNLCTNLAASPGAATGVSSTSERRRDRDSVHKNSPMASKVTNSR